MSYKDVESETYIVRVKMIEEVIDEMLSNCRFDGQEWRG